MEYGKKLVVEVLQTLQNTSEFFIRNLDEEQDIGHPSNRKQNL